MVHSVSSESSEIATIDLKQSWRMFKRHWLPASSLFLLTVTCFTIAGSIKTPIYQTEGKLLIRKVSSTSSLTGVGQQIGELESVDRQGSPLDTEIEIILSGPIIQKAITQLNLKNKNGDPLKQDQVRRNLSVSKVMAGDILQVSYEHTDPEKAMAVVNALMKLYLENNIIVYRDQALTAREFIEKQLPRAEENVDLAEEALRQFEEEHQIFALEEEIKSIATLADNLQNQIFQAQASLANNSSDLSIKETVQQLKQAESQLAIEKKRFTGVNPSIIELESQVASLKELLQAQKKEVFGKQQQNLKGQINSLSKLEAVYKQKSKILPVLKQEQKQLERKLETAQATYLQLLQKRKDIQFTENQNFVNARIISPATLPDKPAYSYKSLYSGVGILLGIVIAGTTVFLLELRKQSTFATIKAIRKHWGFTLLGMIPAVEKKTKMLPSSASKNENIVINFPKSPNYQAYLMLQHNMSWIISKQDLHVIVVTSSIGQEGKSTVSANLALAMAQLGHKVLLIDANLHRPTQHHIWKLPNQFGLSEMLLKGESQLGITKIMNNLDVITSGALPPSPTSLFNSSSMTVLIKQFANNYDFVIFDTPSLNEAVDACILGKMSDGIVLVAEARRFEPNGASFVKEMLVQFDQNVVGMVINGT